MCGRERAGFLALLAVLAPGALGAQTDAALLPAPGIAVIGGVVSTDLGPADPADGGAVFGLRLDFPLASRIVLEPSVERLSLDTGDEDPSVRWQLDFALRGEIPLGPVRPFLGGALGALLWPGDQRPTEADFVVATYGGLAGLLYDVTPRFGLRGEVRLRWLDGLESRITTVDAGVRWRF